MRVGNARVVRAFSQPVLQTEPAVRGRAPGRFRRHDDARPYEEPYTFYLRLQGKEGDLLRLVLKWSLALTVVMAILVTLQAYVLRFMIPG